MMRGKKSLFWLLATGLLASLLVLSGCGDDGSDGRDGIDGIDGQDGADYAPVEGEVAGILACSTCHANNSATQDWLTSPHAGLSGAASSAYAGSGTSCAPCHNPAGENADMNAAFGEYTQLGVVGCESCHGGGSAHVNLPRDYAVPNKAPLTEQCIACHNDGLAGHVERGYTISNDVGGNFLSSRHANQGARTGFCSSCHSHEGALELLSMDRFTSTAALDAAYNENSVDAYSLPVGSDTIVGVMKKNCATCHDPHTAGLRGMGDITASEIDGLLPAGATTFEEATVVYSAEFNLCTACHMVDLDVAYSGITNKGTAGIEYTLSDAYSAASMIDATTGTYKEIELTNAGRSVIGAAFYHDGASGNGRTMADTHFGGTILGHLVDFEAGTADITIEGYNINAGARNACTTCHDAHTAGKMLSIDSSSTIDYADQYDNKAVSYAEGLGAFHNSYQTTAAYRASGCTPCHNGDAFATYTNEGDMDHMDDSWNTLGCRGCHDLAVPNAEPASNNSEAFAAVRTFPEDFVFEFNSGAVVTEDLGNNSVCFECHKGRTPYNDDPSITTVYGVGYLHYAPSFATLFGDASEMVPTYEGKTYAGRFQHPAFDGVAVNMGCVDCHDVHNTQGNDAAQNRMTNPAYNCSGCHAPGAFADAYELRDRTVAYGDRLFETIRTKLADYVATDDDAAAIINGSTAIFGDADYATGTTVEAVNSRLKAYLTGSSRDATGSRMPNNAFAKAGKAWKVFNYDDGSPSGTVHGHGGSWAHNSKFARQVQYDAIESLGGDLTGLTRP